MANLDRMEYQYQTGRASRRGERKRRLTEKRKKRKRLWLLVAIVVVLLGLGAYFGISRLALKPSKPAAKGQDGQEKKTSTTKGKATKTPKVERISFLVVGASNVDGKEQAQGILFLVLDKTAKKLTAISIPENTLVDIPGFGFEKASLALSSGGMPTVVTTMKNFLEVPVDHQSKLEYENFKHYLDLDSFENLLGKAKETDLNKEEKVEYSRLIAKIDLENTRKVALPVKPLMMDNKVYFEPVRESIDRLVEEVYGIKKRKTLTTRVVILNGCGIPGIAGKVTEKLVQNGYKITESKNADNFNYAVTQIISFKADLTIAKNVREILGVGEVVRKRAPQDLVDLAVIIGKDYPTGN